MAEYDPVARREYYLRTRELKGREKAKDTKSKSSDGKPKVQLGPKMLGKSSESKEKGSGRSAANKAKSNRNWANSQVSKEISKKRQAEITQIQSLAKARREEISNKFKAVMQQITNDTEKKRKALEQERKLKLAKVAAERTAKLASIPDIPDNVSAEMYETLRLRRTKKIRKIKGDAAREESTIRADFSKKKGELAEQTRKNKTFLRDVTKAQSDQVKLQLQTSLNDAKQKYEGLKGRLGPKS